MNSCKDCPWTTDKHKSWKNWVIKTPTVKDRLHKCHNKDIDTWGHQSEITSENQCQGRKKYLENKKIQNEKN